MKWLVYILSFYILLSSGIPCEADSDCCQDEVITTLPHKPANDPDHTPTCPCSPFFACGTCHAVTIPGSVISIPKAPPPVTKQYCFYTVQSLTDLPDNIWQPPQLGAPYLARA